MPPHYQIKFNKQNGLRKVQRILYRLENAQFCTGGSHQKTIKLQLLTHVHFSKRALSEKNKISTHYDA